MLRRLPILALAATGLILTNCGDDDEEEHSATEEGCEHMDEGPFVNVTASADIASPATPPAFEHSRLDVALVDLSPGNGGYVAFDADEATEFIFFLSADIPFEVLDSTDTAVVPDETPHSNPDCTTLIPKMVTVDLAVGAYKLSFGDGSTTATTVGLVYEEAGEHHHDE